MAPRPNCQLRQKSRSEALDSTKEMAMARVDQLVQAKFALLKGTTSEEREKVLNAAAELAANERMVPCC